MSQTPSTDAAHAASRAQTWSDERTERLKALWAAGDLTASLIARRLGVSRNAVLGKVHRLGLSNQRPPPQTRVARAPRPTRPSGSAKAGGVSPPATALRPPRGSPSAALAAPASAELTPGLVARLEDLPRRTCHWPIGDPLGTAFRFCGRKAAQAPYCDVHRRVAYKPGGPRPIEDLLRRRGGA